VSGYLTDEDENRRRAGESRPQDPAGETADRLGELLDAVACGGLQPAAAREELSRLGISQVGDFARLDVGRAHRTGVPEVVLARGKTPGQLADVVMAFSRHSGLVLCSKTSREQAAAVEEALQTGWDGPGPGEPEQLERPSVVYDERAAVLTVTSPDYRAPEPCGVIGVVAAGTSDVAVAEEAAIVGRAMAVEVITAYDVGVAGLHRLGGPLSEMMERGAAALVVAAGMEGALPSVVAGLVDVPVIGLPTSVGYGYGGDGEAALMGMLQSCVPGLVVVNIDNGVGAGITAALIARRAVGAC